MSSNFSLKSHILYRIQIFFFSVQSLTATNLPLTISTPRSRWNRERQPKSIIIIHVVHRLLCCPFLPHAQPQNNPILHYILEDSRQPPQTDRVSGRDPYQLVTRQQGHLLKINRKIDSLLSINPLCHPSPSPRSCSNPLSCDKPKLDNDNNEKYRIEASPRPPSSPQIDLFLQYNVRVIPSPTFWTRGWEKKEGDQQQQQIHFVSASSLCFCSSSSARVTGNSRVLLGSTSRWDLATLESIWPTE